MRAMWKGAIAFGLVNIPVELYSATRDHRPKFRLLHAKDESPVDSLSAKWEPAKYTDEYKENLMRVIKGKLKGKAPRLKERETPQQADVIDLMARLRASLEGRAEKGSRAGKAAKAATRAAGSTRAAASRRTGARKRRVA